MEKNFKNLESSNCEIILKEQIWNQWNWKQRTRGKKINKTKSSFFETVNKNETSGKTNLEEHWIDLVLFKETEFVAKSLLKKKPSGLADFPCEFY